MNAKPRTVAELQDAVRSAPTVCIRGAGTKSPALQESDANLTIDMTGLTGITEYAPEECVFTAMAGTTLAEINAQLAVHGQYLPFDPPLADAGATIGGTVAAALSGSCRYRYGGVRDFVIGARVVDGNGTIIRSGGKVVKNAAGFLLHHGLVGSSGRFGAITELTFKVFPAPEARATLQVNCSSAQNAFDAARDLERRRCDLEAVDFDSSGVMWVRVAGRAEAMAARVKRLRESVGPSAVLQDSADQQVWNDAREFSWVSPAYSIIKVPANGPFLTFPLARYTCAGGVAWVAVEDPRTADGISGVVVRGRHAGLRIGMSDDNAFEERVRRVLDPLNRFRAASHSDR